MFSLHQTDSVCCSSSAVLFCFHTAECMRTRSCFGRRAVWLKPNLSRLRAEEALVWLLSDLPVKRAEFFLMNVLAGAETHRELEVSTLTLTGVKMKVIKKDGVLARGEERVVEMISNCRCCFDWLSLQIRCFKADKCLRSSFNTETLSSQPASIQPSSLPRRFCSGSDVKMVPNPVCRAGGHQSNPISIRVLRLDSRMVLFLM